MCTFIHLWLTFWAILSCILIKTFNTRQSPFVRAQFRLSPVMLNTTSASVVKGVVSVCVTVMFVHTTGRPYSCAVMYHMLWVIAFMCV